MNRAITTPPLRLRTLHMPLVAWRAKPYKRRELTTAGAFVN